MGLTFLLLLTFASLSLSHFQLGENNEGYDRSLKDFRGINIKKQTKWNSISKKKSFLEETRFKQPFPDHLFLYLNAFDSFFKFSLSINQNIINQNTRITVMKEDGKEERRLASHRYYLGSVENEKGEKGIARLTLIENEIEIKSELTNDNFFAQNSTSGKENEKEKEKENQQQNDALFFVGFFTVNNEMYHIQRAHQFFRLNSEIKRSRLPFKRDNFDEATELIIYKQSDIEIHTESEKCGVEGSHFEIEHFFEKSEKNTYEFQSEFENVFFSKKTRAPVGCPVKPKVLYMGVASDCSYSSEYSTDELLEENILTNWNAVSSIYEKTFNIALGVIDIRINRQCGGTGMTWNQQCSTGYSITNRLSDFSRWRGTQPEDAGLWHLLSKCSTGSTVGIAWLNMLCQTSTFDQTVDGMKQFVSGTAVSTLVREQFIVIAHEIGHNFGAKHDCVAGCVSGQTSCCGCTPNCDCFSQFIMNPTNGAATNNFSPCTQNLICSRSSTTGTCLADPGTRTVKNAGVCGNGVWEPPLEECDCGGNATCSNNTCCFSNCTLRAGAQCDDSSTGCCSNCQIVRETNVICRAKAGDCDVDEFCTGSSPICPRDSFVTDGTPCLNNNTSETYCASGLCTNRDLQCVEISKINENPTYTQSCLTSCKVFCKSPLEQGCSFFTGVFRNGTKCGKNNDGFCYNGLCSEFDFIDSFLKILDDYKIYFIIGGVIIGLLILFGFYMCCCRASKKKTLNRQDMISLSKNAEAVPNKRQSQAMNNQRQSQAMNNQRQSQAMNGPRDRASSSASPRNSNRSSAALNPNNYSSSPSSSPSRSSNRSSAALTGYNQSSASVSASASNQQAGYSSSPASSQRLTNGNERISVVNQSNIYSQSPPPYNPGFGVEVVMENIPLS